MLADTPTLTTERLTLRAPRMEEFAGFEAFYVSERSIALAQRLGCHPDPEAPHPDSELPPAQVYPHPGPGQIA